MTGISALQLGGSGGLSMQFSRQNSGQSSGGFSGSIMVGNAQAQAFGQNIAERARNDVNAVRSSTGIQSTEQSVATEQSGTAAANTSESVSGKAPVAQEAVNALAAGLSEAIQFINERHGEQAGTAVMGLIYQKLGTERVTEDNLGDALLDGIKFLDRNFGIAEGDAVIEKLNNGGLNSAINDFFDNGSNERFLAMTTEVKAGLQDAVDKVALQVQSEYGEAAGSEISGLFEQLRLDINGNDFSKVKKGLKLVDEAMAKLKEQAAGNASVGGELTGQMPFSGLLSGPLSASPGSFLDITV